MSKTASIASWVFSLAVTAVYLQTLFFKFTGANESVYIFQKVAGPEMEALARIGSGVGELIAAVVIVVPRTRVYGASLSMAVISGAIFSHLTILGIIVLDDGGLLFILACLVLLFSLGLIFIHRSEIPFLSEKS